MYSSLVLYPFKSARLAVGCVTSLCSVPRHPSRCLLSYGVRLHDKQKSRLNLHLGENPFFTGQDTDLNGFVVSHDNNSIIYDFRFLRNSGQIIFQLLMLSCLVHLPSDSRSSSPAMKTSLSTGIPLAFHWLTAGTLTPHSLATFVVPPKICMISMFSM